MDYSNQILEGDCTRLLPTLPEASVDLVVTDPPYLVRYKDCTGRTLADDDSPDTIHQAFSAAYCALKPNSFCVSFYGWNRVNVFFDAWRSAGFRPVGHTVWHKKLCLAPRLSQGPA